MVTSNSCHYIVSKQSGCCLRCGAPEPFSEWQQTALQVAQAPAASLRERLGEAQWELWMQHARLLAVLPCRQGYFSRIEMLFQRERGSALLLSPLDCLLIGMWADCGIDLVAVLRGIDAAFDRYSDRSLCTRQINSLHFCRQHVLHEQRNMMEAAVGSPSSFSSSFRAIDSHADRPATLLVGLPPRGRAIFAALQRKSQVEQMFHTAGVGVAFTVYPDEYQQAQALDRFGVLLQSQKLLPVEAKRQ